MLLIKDCVKINNMEKEIQIIDHKESYKLVPRNDRDMFARAIVHIMAQIMDFLFKSRYGHRAVVLETIAAVPGMVGGLLQHLKSLRLIKDDKGIIKLLLDEAENERMHLMVYSKIAKPDMIERILIMIVQLFFYNLYFALYLISPSTAHRVVGYFEEEAIHSYEVFLNLVKAGEIKNVKAPEIAVNYWKLDESAKLEQIIEKTIIDEMKHRDVNHELADKM